MKAFRRVRAAVGTGVLAAAVAVSNLAHAGFATIPKQDIGKLVGDDTSGSETGIYEIVANQVVLIFAITGMVMATAGFMLFRTWLRRGRG